MSLEHIERRIQIYTRHRYRALYEMSDNEILYHCKDDKVLFDLRGAMRKSDLMLNAKADDGLWVHLAWYMKTFHPAWWAKYRAFL